MEAARTDVIDISTAKNDRNGNRKAIMELSIEQSWGFARDEMARQCASARVAHGVSFMSRLLLTFLALIFFATPVLAQDQMMGLPPRSAPTAHVQVQQLPIVDATPKFDA